MGVFFDERKGMEPSGSRVPCGVKKGSGARPQEPFFEAAYLFTNVHLGEIVSRPEEL